MYGRVRGQVPQNPSMLGRRVCYGVFLQSERLSRNEGEGYNGFANEGLWPLCHLAHTRPIFRAADWESYKKINERFADAILEEVGDEAHPVILIQGCHFALLPRLVKERMPHARIAIFWHIP
jgi:trehalose 6-phosphate synthase